MTTAQTTTVEINKELLMMNHFCKGIKHGYKYECGDEADEEVKNVAIELLTEAIKRMLRWQIWNDWWINEYKGKWLKAKISIEEKLRGKYSGEIVNTLSGLIDEIINYMDNKLGKYWLSNNVGNEIKELIEYVKNGKANIIIWKNESGISIYDKHTTLIINKPKNRRSIVMQLTFKGLEGLTVYVPNVFKGAMSEEDYGKFIKDLLIALKSGLNDTDGSITHGKPRMGTSNLWQIIAWLLLHPGEVHIRADTINVNKNSITVRWSLTANDESYKGSILRMAKKLSVDTLMSFMFTALLGDGSVLSRKKAAIKITISSRKFKKWVSLLDRLSELGFRWNLDPDPRGDIFYVKFNSGYAVDLAKAMINVAPELLKDILDAFNVKKWEDLKEVANLRVKFRKIGSQVFVAGVKFTVDVQKWTIRLRRQVNDYERVKEILDKLKNEYGDEFVKQISAYKYGNYYIITIPASLIEKHESIREQVIKVLQEKLKNTNDEKRKQIITKHLTRLTTYTENRTATNMHNNK